MKAGRGWGAGIRRATGSGQKPRKEWEGQEIPALSPGHHQGALGPAGFSPQPSSYGEPDVGARRAGGV